jgi:Flp pilus assembly protein protease CpaA
VVVVGGTIARHDVRTRTIPNRWVVTLATAGVALSLSSPVVRHHPEILLPTVFAAALVAGYFAFGLMGWVGFDDAKLAGGLALVTSVAVGSSSTLSIPCAVLLGGAQRILFARLVERRTPQPHASALMAAGGC